jgi:CBS domain containing-hemolysin-like protein
MFELILASLIAIFMSAACSVSEAALYAVTWSQIEHLRKQGRRSGEVLFRLRSDVEKPISVILTVNTVANTAGASIVGAAAVKTFGSETMGLFVAAFTVVILIFSEILPKTIGVAYARQLAPVLALPLHWMVVVFTPFITVVSVLTRLIQRGNKGPQTTEDDIRAIASLTRSSGRIQPYEEVAIRNILALDTKTVSDIMTPRTVVFSLPAQMTVDETRLEPNIWHYSRIAVYDNDDTEDIVGVVYRRDILERLANDENQTPLSAIMRPARFIQETLTLDRLLNKFLESRVHLYVALDEYGGLSGVVSLEDVIEEILGKEIVDETDEVVDLRAYAKKQRESIVKARAEAANEAEAELSNKVD